MNLPQSWLPTWLLLATWLMQGNLAQPAVAGLQHDSPPVADPQLPEKATVFAHGHDGYHTFRIPSLLVTARGTVLALCEGRRQSASDFGDIDLVCKRSTDGGKTWSRLQTIWDDGPNTCGNACSVVDGTTGFIWLLMTWNRGEDQESAIVAQRSKDTRPIFVTGSTDDGLTWSPPHEITQQVKPTNWTWYATGPGAGIQIQHGPNEGRLVVPCDHIEAGTRHYGAHVIYSDDHGQTWKLGGSAPSHQVNECEVVELENGRLLLNMRNYDLANPTRQIALSADGGVTWSDQRHDPDLLDPVCQASIRRYSWPGNGRPGVILFSNPASRKRERMTVRASFDNGRTWPVRRVLDAGPSAYSCLSILPEGAIGLLYETGIKSAYEGIALARFSMDWLTNRNDEQAQRVPDERLAVDSLIGRRPNIMFILTDDQGYGDMSCHGHPILTTPNIDRLHDEGVRFTDYHVSPTCSPTRAALLTGRHEFKNGVTHTILERERLTLDATTLAQVLKSAGYATGIFGKWHLGDEPAYRPDRRGFDEVFIHGGGGIGQTYPGSCGDAPGNTYFDPAILHNGVFEKTRGYCTDVFFGQAIHWVEGVKGRQPFFAYIACNAPHVPLQVRPEDEARYVGKVANTNAARFLGMVANIDDNIGRLLTKLREWDLDRQTLVIFMTDNGADGGLLAGYNAGMRGGKGTAFLGGTRAASFWRWPGTLVPGDRQALTAHIDFFPTITAMAGAKLSEKVQSQVEGRSLVPLLADPAASWPERVLFTHLGRWPKGADPAIAKYRACSVRTSRWHVVSPDGGKDPHWMLFDVAQDYGEMIDAKADYPDVIRQLGAQFDAWWNSLDGSLVNEPAVGPRINPFKELFWQQFGGRPSGEDLRLMDMNENPATRAATQK